MLRDDVVRALDDEDFLEEQRKQLYAHWAAQIADQALHGPPPLLRAAIERGLQKREEALQKREQALLKREQALAQETVDD